MTPVLQELSLTGCLPAEVPLARHLIFGALNWSAKWFEAKKETSLDDLTDAMMALLMSK